MTTLWYHEESGSYGDKAQVPSHQPGRADISLARSHELVWLLKP